VVVEEGAEVCDAILFHDSVIESGATVHYAIVDRLVRIGADARVGGQPKGDLPTSEELTLIGQAATIEGGSTVERGARVESGATG
jgi:glucose-1-phosphate adenylyltransferase